MTDALVIFLSSVELWCSPVDCITEGAYPEILWNISGNILDPWPDFVGITISQEFDGNLMFIRLTKQA